MIEVIISLIILGVAITAGLQSLGGFAAGARAWRERSTSIELANALMAQVNTLPFSDPAGSATIGVEAPENATNCDTFDDLDDYNGWDASPPKRPDGTPMNSYMGYRQQVAVAFDNSLAARMGVSLTAGSFKKITVTISKDDKVLTRLVTVRAKQSGMPASQ